MRQNRRCKVPESDWSAVLLVVGEGDENALALDPLASEVEELAVCGPVASVMDHSPKVTRNLPQSWRWQRVVKLASGCTPCQLYEVFRGGAEFEASLVS